MTASKIVLNAASGVGGEALNVEDVFSTYLYEGTGSTQTISNNIALGAGGGFQTTVLRETQSQATAVARDSSDNVYMVFTGNHGTNNDGAVVGKFSSTGENIWYAGLRNTSYSQDTPFDLAVDSNNNVYVVGKVRTSSSLSKGFLAKFNSSGTLQFQRGIFASSVNSTDQEFTGIAIDSSNNVYVVGSYYRSGISNLNGLVAKYDSSGTLLFQKEIRRDNYFLRGRSIALDSGGNIIVSFWGRDNSNVDNSFVLKLNSSGSETWERRIYNPSNQSTEPSYNGIVVDSNDNYYVCNNYSGYFILTKFNSSGTRQWIGWPGLNGNNNTSIFMDSSDNLYVTSGQDSVGNVQKVDISNGNVTGGFKFFDYPREDATSTGAVRIKNGVILSTGRIALAITAENGSSSNRATLVLTDNDITGGTSFYKAASLDAISLTNGLNSTTASSSFVSVATGTLSTTSSVLSSYTPSVTLSASPEFEATDGEGGLVWVKNRDNPNSHWLLDSERSNFASRLNTNLSGAQNSDSGAYAVPTSTGFTTKGNDANIGGSSYNYVSWTFRKAPKFFDVVTWNGNNTAGREIAHNLGTTVGTIIVKCISHTSTAWTIYHRSLGSTKYLEFDSGAQGNAGTAYWNSTEPTNTAFTLGNDGNVNATGRSYVAYLFAHNDGDGGFGPNSNADIIKCGSFTGNQAAGNFVDLGFEPQFLLLKNASATEQWWIFDNMRGVVTGGADARLRPSQSNAEDSYDNMTFNATGFTPSSNVYVNGSGHPMVYIAIRRGTAVPTSATEVFAMDTFGGTSPTPPSYVSGFPVDMVIQRHDKNSTSDPRVNSRLTGINFVYTSQSSSETYDSGYTFDYMNGFRRDTGTDANDFTWMWKRAPNYMDVVAYTGNYTARTINHNLGAVPEMIWIKSRSNTRPWIVYHSATGNDRFTILNATDAQSSSGETVWNQTTPTSSVFSIGAQNAVNENSQDFIAYLFASLDGVSKVGSYIGSASDQTIDCGFTNGARLVLIKSYQGGSGNWFLFDTKRGIVAGNDPELSLNNTDAEGDALGDYIDPHSSGFTLVGNKTTNKSGFNFIFYAIA